MGELRAAGFDLRLTLESGQFFRYYEQEDGFLLITQGRAVRVGQGRGVLRYAGADERFVRTLFSLGPEHAARRRRLEKDDVLRGIVRRYGGLRVMRLDAHEAILAFICSSQSNIPKIRMNLHLLAQGCGEPCGEHRLLPQPGASLPLDAVLAAKTGYRAKYLVGANAMLTPEYLRRLREAEYEEAHALLCSLPGVGPKVADCVCLFGLGHGRAFPVDVHVLRAMRALFPRERFKDERAARGFAQERWGEDAGLAQQFIFQWAREHLRKDGRPEAA